MYNMVRELTALLFILGIASPVWALPTGNERSQIIGDLQAIKSDNMTRLQEIEKRIQAHLDQSQQNSLVSTFNVSEIESLNEQRQERLLRQDFLDRLIFQVDTKYTTGDLRAFLSARLSEMARADLMSRESNQVMWKQMSYLSQALRDLPERDGNIVGFVEGYLKASPFNKPIKAEDYLKSRQYTNGRESVAATTPTLEQAAELVEKRIKAGEIAVPVAPASDVSTKP